MVLTDLQYSKRIIQSSGADYIFGEYSQLEGAGPHPASSAPEIHKHSRPSVPVPSGGHAVTLREMLDKNDVFALGHALYSALLGEAEMRVKFPDVASSSTYREWDLPELPAHLSRHTKTFLSRLVCADPARRPSLK